MFSHLNKDTQDAKREEFWMIHRESVRELLNQLNEQAFEAKGRIKENDFRLNGAYIRNYPSFPKANLALTVFRGCQVCIYATLNESLGVIAESRTFPHRYWQDNDVSPYALASVVERLVSLAIE